MTTVTIHGDVPNLALLAEELKPHLAPYQGVQVAISAEPPMAGSLGHAEWGELAIAFASSVVASATWDVIKGAVVRARRRGKIELELPEGLDDSQDPGNSPDGNDLGDRESDPGQ